MPSSVKDRAVELIEQRDDSIQFMESNVYPQWEQVYKNYNCQVEPRKDAKGKVDPDLTALGMPDTFSMVNRMVARVTANIPDISFVAKNSDPSLAIRVSRKCMYDWDTGYIQRWQKKHARQAEMFGWSVKAWYWKRQIEERSKGIDVSRQLTPPELGLIADTYQIERQRLFDPAQQPQIIAALMKRYSRRGLLNVRYDYMAQEGPRADVIFVGDAYPEPYFETIQTSNWFITQRRRDRQWLKDLAEEYPEMAENIADLLSKHPKGTPAPATGGGDVTYFRDRLRNALNQPSEGDETRASGSDTELWTITERHTRGRRAKMAFVAEETIWLGEINCPYDLNGRIPFTDLILNDNILGGVGDSVARVTIGLQAMHNLTTNRRFDLFRLISQPIWGTTDRVFYDNPELLNRDFGRIAFTRLGPNSIFPINDQAAIAGTVAAMSEEGAQMRMFQLASGDSNMSMSANVDPAQVRTATGAKIAQQNQDVLTKDKLDMYGFSIHDDAEMIYLMNRSEMADAVSFNGKQYSREFNPNRSAEKEEWITAEPTDFQEDGRIIVKPGSTLADDDEANVARATNNYTLLGQDPDVNRKVLVRDLLVASGKGDRLEEYMVQDPPPPPPPAKASLSLAAKMELLTPGERLAAFDAAGIPPEKIEEMTKKADEMLLIQISAPDVDPAAPQMLPPGAPPDMAPPQMEMPQ